MPTSYLVVLGEREALAWVLRSKRMAFASYRARDAAALEVGDELFLLTSRGCFHNPARDRTRVIGVARVASRAATLKSPIRLANRDFTVACDLHLQGLARYLQGIEVAPLVDRLEVFPKKHAWPITLRRALVRLPEADARLFRSLIKSNVEAPARVVPEYLASIKPVAVVRE